MSEHARTLKGRRKRRPLRSGQVRRWEHKT